jgi:hypothetical protein
MRARTLAPLVLASAALCVGCGGEAETVTVTETVTETVIPEGEDDRAFQLAYDVCSGLPRALVSAFLGVSPRASDQLAQEFARLARPELREPARDGCLDALEDE